MVKITFDEIKPINATADNSASLEIELTIAAAKRIAEVVACDKEGHKYLRVGVVGGGCGGFSYLFKLEKTKGDDDVELTNSTVIGAVALIDSFSVNQLKGSVIDFEETIEASKFVVKNPNAKSSCGCGNSFSL